MYENNFIINFILRIYQLTEFCSYVGYGIEKFYLFLNKIKLCGAINLLLYTLLVQYTIK